jgi:hypothetical protein
MAKSGFRNTVLVAIGASFAKRQRIVMELATHTIVGHTAISFSSGTKSAGIIRVVHTKINGVAHS